MDIGLNKYSATNDGRCSRTSIALNNFRAKLQTNNNGPMTRIGLHFPAEDDETIKLIREPSLNADIR